MDFEKFPLAVGWELTLACNLRCRHCGSSAGVSRRNELTLNESLAICDQLPELLVAEVDFTGGEPLCSPHWEPLVARLRDLRIRTKVITNGLLLEAEVIRRLRGAGVSRVGISLDGMEAVHDRIRGRPGLFRKVLAGVDGLLEAGIPVTAITTVSDLNVSELPNIRVLLAEHGVDVWQFQPLFPLGRALECAEMTLSQDSYMKFGAFAKDWTQRPGQIPASLPGDSFGYYTDLDRRQPAWAGCSAGLALCGITADGRIKGCLSMPDAFAEGNLRESDLWGIWFNPNGFAYNRQFTDEKLGPNCRSCQHAAACKGGCSSMSFGLTGHFHDDPCCFWALSKGNALPLEPV